MTISPNDPIKKVDNKAWRWIAAFSVFLNIIFNYYHNINPFSGQTVGDTSRQYPNLFTPASYAFSIWALIFFSFTIYAIVQLLPSQQKIKIYNRLTGPLILTSWLSMSWIVLFTHEYLGTSVIIIMGMLITAIILFNRSKDWVLRRKENTLLPVPFSLYMGWLSIAAIANMSVWLSRFGWRGEPFGEVIWAIIMLILALILAFTISYRYKDLIYPLVIAWGTFAIWIRIKDENGFFALTALIVSIIIVAWVIIFGFLMIRKLLKPSSA